MTPDNTTSYIIASTAGGLGNTTPKKPNHVGLGGTVGQFTGFGEPFVNESGNIAFLADVNIFEFELSQNLQALLDAELPSSFIDKKSIFCVDGNGDLQTVVVVGMKIADLDPGEMNQGLIITDLIFESETNQIDATETLESRGSAYQDGRRMPMTNQKTEINPGENCKFVNIAFVAIYRNINNPLIPLDRVVVSELTACQGTNGCTSCLCSLDPDCVYGGLLLNSGPDFDGDRQVNTVDLLITNDALGLTEGRADLTNDGIVDNQDLDAILDSWGSTQPE